MSSDAVTLTCPNGHEFESRAKPGNQTDCSECRRAGLGRVSVTVPRDVVPLSPIPGPDSDEVEPDDDDGFSDDGSIPAELLEQQEDSEPEEEQERKTEPAHPLPGFLRDGKRPRKAKVPTPKIRVTAAIRKDVEAKIRFVLMPGAQLFAMRDPVCGSVAVEQEPEISSAFAEIVCDSPDLVAWFTGPAGGFMKYFRLVMAVQPVLMIGWAHHIAHAVIEPEAMANGQQPDYSAYPA